MNAISVGYRFSRKELSAMLQALQINGLPAAPLEPVGADTARHVFDRLIAEGMAMIANNTLYVDKVIGYLLQAASQPKSGVVITDKARTAVLWQADKLWILGEFAADGECVLTPLPDIDAAQAALVDAICRMARPLWGMNVFNPGRRFSVPGDSSLSERQIALELMVLIKE